MRYAKLLPLALAAISLGCAETRAPEDYPDAVAADPSHYSVEFENDAVRVLRVEYDPGDVSVMHRHPALCSVGLADAAWSMTDPDDVVTESPNAFGEVQCGEAGVHLPENSGSELAAAVLIEFKDGTMAGSMSSEFPDAVTADPDHYSVEFENDVVRMIRIRYAAGETSVMHHHPAGCGIWLMTQPGTMETPTGDVQENAAATTGNVTCNDAIVHLPSNTGAGISELVFVELKGREAFQAI